MMAAHMSWFQVERYTNVFPSRVGWGNPRGLIPTINHPERQGESVRFLSYEWFLPFLMITEQLKDFVTHGD